jgi:2-polyprenyl-3-methyl-5-hydroxy-6-metoxy-1,4-benzoquinol methylase
VARREREDQHDRNGILGSSTRSPGGLVPSTHPARAAARAARYPIAYDAAFLERVLDFHAGSESLPGYAGWIADHMGGRVTTFRARLLPHIRAFTDLRGLDVLDFGCGTGSSLVVLSEASQDSVLTGIDVDAAGPTHGCRVASRHASRSSRGDIAPATTSTHAAVAA